MNTTGLILIVLFVLGKVVVEFAGKVLPGSNDSAKKDENTPGAPSEPPLRPAIPKSPSAPSQTETDEERTRRFLQALGLPAESLPPRQISPRSSQAMPTTAGESRNTEVVGTKQISVPKMQPKVRPVRRPIAPPSEPVIAQVPIPKTASVSDVGPQMEVASIPELRFASEESYRREPVPDQNTSPGGKPLGSVSATQPGKPIPMRVQLRGREALRKAIVMREILGAPKSLRSEREPSTFSPL